MTKMKTMIGGTCLLACLAGGAAIATAGDEAGPAPVPEAAAAQAEPVTAVPDEQAEQIEQLDRARTPDDAMPSEWREDLTTGSQADEHWGANPSLSRRTAPGTWI